MRSPRAAHAYPIVVSVVVGLPAAALIWTALLTPTAADINYSAATIAIAVGTAAYLVRYEAKRVHNAESRRINERSRDADKQLEAALAERQGVNAEAPRQDEPLVLAKLWESVNSRLEKYHNDAQTQGRQAFVAAMTAMWIGFLVLVPSGAAAVTASTTTGAIVTGSLGGVSAAVAGYIAKTFLRAHEETSRHLRGYFLQPVEMSRCLSAERVIAQSGLPTKAQTELMRVLIHSMVTGALAEDSGPATARP